VLLSETSRITELEIDVLEIDMSCNSPPTMGLTRVLRALALHPALTKLVLRRCPLGHDEVGLLRMVLDNISSLHTLVLTSRTLGSAALAELAPALYQNTSIKELDLSGNGLNNMESASILRDVIRSNKIMTTLDLSRNSFGQTTGTVDCIAGGLSSNSTLLKIDLSCCALGDDGVSILAQTLGSRNTTLQKLALNSNSITSTGVGVLLEAMEQNSHITDLELRHNPIRNVGASLLGRALGKNALPNLTRLYLGQCGIGDDGFIALVSALEQNTSLLHLDSCYTHVSVSGPFWPSPRVYQRSKFCNKLTFIGAKVLPLPCLCCW
jgi:Ran GTPase-activating protein (RanGAP) involved in mRNA processing and transport